MTVMRWAQRQQVLLDVADVFRAERFDTIQVMADEIDPTLWPSLVRSADTVLHTPDGWVLLRITLPRAARPA